MIQLNSLTQKERKKCTLASTPKKKKKTFPLDFFLMRILYLRMLYLHTISASTPIAKNCIKKFKHAKEKK